MGPSRLAGSALRAVAGAGRAPLIGRGVRAAAAAMLGLSAIRTGSLPPAPPYDPRVAPDMPARAERPGPQGAGG